MRSRHLPGLPVLALESGTAIGRVRRPIVDPGEKCVAALLVSEPRSVRKRLLPVDAVRAFGRHAVTVESERALILPRDDSRLFTLLVKKRISLLGTAVVTAGGELVGTVRDFEIGERGKISCLYINGGMWRSLAGREQEIPGSAIIAIGKDAAIVTDETLEVLSQEKGGSTGQAEQQAPPARPWFRWSKENQDRSGEPSSFGSIEEEGR